MNARYKILTFLTLVLLASGCCNLGINCPADSATEAAPAAEAAAPAAQ